MCIGFMNMSMRLIIWVHTYLVALRTIASLLFPKTATISRGTLVAVEVDNELAIVQIVSK